MKFKFFETLGMGVFGSVSYYSASTFFSFNKVLASTSNLQTSGNVLNYCRDWRNQDLSERYLKGELKYIEDNKNIGHIILDRSLWDGASNKHSKLVRDIENTIIRNNQSYRTSDYLHGILSSHVYEVFDQDEITQINNPNRKENVLVKFKDTSKNDKYSGHLNGWSISSIVTEGERGYYGTIYCPLLWLKPSPSGEKDFSPCTY